MNTLETPKIYESNVVINTIWKRKIPWNNMSSMAIFLLLVFGLDLFIVISSPDLIFFWYIMLAVLGGFLIFFFLENLLFIKKFADHKSKLDLWIFLIIIVRNFIFLLNFIPFIQVLGLILLPFIFVPVCLVLYTILIICRFVVAKKIKNLNASV